jgi:hypothetical protein
MKRIARVAAAAVLSLGLLAQPALAAESKLQIVLQGAPVQFEVGADPFVENSRTLVPLRTLSEKLGFMVDYEATTQQITLTKFPTKVVLWVGKLEAEVNGKPLTLEVAPKIIGNRTFVPLRFISEQLGANVFYNGDRNEVRLTPQGQSDPAALAFLSQKPAPSATVQNQKAHADLWLKVTEPGKDPVEMNAGINLQIHGQEILGDLALTMPMMGVNVPMANAQLAVRNGFIWAKLEGGLLAQQLGVPTKAWLPLGSMTELGASLKPELGATPGADLNPDLDATPGTNPNPDLGSLPGANPAQFEQLSKAIMEKILVTFGPSEVKDGKKLVRLDVDMSRIDFMAVGAQVLGQPVPDATRAPQVAAKMSVWVEEESHAARMMKFEVKIADTEMAMEMKLDLTLDPATAEITWPADLPTAVPADSAEPLFPFPVPTPAPGGHA